MEQTRFHELGSQIQSRPLNLDQVDYQWLFKEEVSSTLEIKHGGNNRAFKVCFKDGRLVLVKAYHRDERKRLEVDFGSHSFLWGHGVRCIAEPLQQNINAYVAVYEYILGAKSQNCVISRNDIDQLLDFVFQLNSLSKYSAAKGLSKAAEASFSISDLVHNLKCRYNKIANIPINTSESGVLLASFREKRLKPLFSGLDRWLAEMSNTCEYSYTEKLNMNYATLSPSDFGFHNALLRHKDNQWIFGDFEYFGWDDPCKLIADFLLHPGQNISRDIRDYFLKEVVAYFSKNDKQLSQRLKIVFPLFALKWTLILLNEFFPEFKVRRKLSGFNEEEKLQKAQHVQLMKADLMLKKFEESFFNNSIPLLKI